MSKKNWFLLAVGYIAGGLVASLYSKKTSTTLKKDLGEAKAKGEGSFKVLTDNFLETHANLIENLKDEILKPENKAKFEKGKVEIIKIINSYKTKGATLLKELKVKGEGYLGESSKKLEALYNEKLTEVKKIKNVAPEKIEELKTKLTEVFQQVKTEMQNFAKK